MPTRVRSFSKINLGLAIGPPRPDGFHSLATLYCTLALHDIITVAALPGRSTRITLESNDARVPRDSRNTVWKMLERALERLGRTASIRVHIQKNLPIQGGMGAGSANAAAALLGLERELGLELTLPVRLELAAQVGSDVPLFLLGGSVLGEDRGQIVRPVPDLTLDGATQIPCVIALPEAGVSTPQAFRDWDARMLSPDLHKREIRDTLAQLGRTYASVFSYPADAGSWSIAEQSGASGIKPLPNSLENLQGLSQEQRPSGNATSGGIFGESGPRNDLAGNSLLALVRTGIENDFETVVFPQHPRLREIKCLLMGSGRPHRTEDDGCALYAALSGSGSALFGLYRTEPGAAAAQQRLLQYGVKALVTSTLPRPLYWSQMFAE